MSSKFESLNDDGKRKEALEAARELVAKDDLLAKDELTQQMIESGFVGKNGDVYDPGDWINDRREVLVEREESAVETAHLRNSLAEDQVSKHSSNKWRAGEQP